MSELRKDPIIGRWVIVATERAKRPHDFAVAREDSGIEPCPFCEGNEQMTPGEIFSVRDPATKPNSPGWKIRVIASINPFFTIEQGLDRQGVGMYDKISAVGAHEVIIESPQHVSGISDLTVEQIIGIINTYIERMRDLERDVKCKYVLIFRNYGRPAGASSIKHSHSQLVATPVNPRVVKRELEGAKRYYAYKERCVFCDILKQELEEGKRVVTDEDGFVTLAPYASRFPFELMILPKRHSPDFWTMKPVYIDGLARAIKTTMVKLKKCLNDPPYNWVIHTAPFRRSTRSDYWRTINEDYHWHIEIIPRLTGVAGFEWGTGFYINPVPPEAAAAALKATEV